MSDNEKFFCETFGFVGFKNLPDNLTFNSYSIDEFRSSYKEYIESRRILESDCDFFAIYEEYYKSSLGIESLFNSCESVMVEPEFVNDIYGFTYVRIIRLCDELIRVGNIMPILFLALNTYWFSCFSEYPRYNLYITLNFLLREYSLEYINGKNIADICDEFIEWYKQKYSDENPGEEIGIDTILLTTAYANEFICTKILKIDTDVMCFSAQESTAVDLPNSMIGLEEKHLYEKHIKSSELDKIINEKIVDVYGENTIAKVGWLMSVCYWLNQAGLAYVSKQYILPAINSIRFNGSALGYRVVRLWFNRCGVFSNNLIDFDPENLKEIYNKSVVTFDDKFYLVKDEPFSKVFRTPCRGFGSKLYSFLESGRTDNISNSDSDTRDKADDKKELINYLKYQSEAEYEILLMLSILFMFADEEIDEGVQVLIRHFDLLSRTKHSINPRVALLKAFYAVDDLYIKSELYNIFNREVIRSAQKYSENNNANRVFSVNLIDEIENEMRRCSLRVAEKLIEKITKKSAEISEALSHFETLSEREFQELKAEEQKLEEQVNKLSEISSVFKIKTTLHYDMKINKSIADFYESIGSSQNKDIYSAIGNKTQELIKSYLRQGELIMDLQKDLLDITWQTELDFSAPVLYITKSLEYIGNLIFSKLVNNVNADNLYNSLSNKYQNNMKNFYMKTTRKGNITGWVDFITLGSVAHIYGNPAFRQGDIDILKLIDEKKLKSLDKKTAYVDKNGKHKFTNNVGANLDTLYEAIQQATNYRNSAAHKETVNANLYDQCKELMITTKHLLWITLYIIRDEDDNGNKIILGD